MNSIISAIQAQCINKGYLFHLYIDTNGPVLDIAASVYQGNKCVYMDNKSSSVDEMITKVTIFLNESGVK